MAPPARPAPAGRVPRGAASAAAARAPSAPRRSRAQAATSALDLGARILVAVPAIAVALFLVIEGGLVFALGLFVLGCVCLHELYAMYDRAHPVRLAGFLALAALLIAALYGDQFQVLLVLVAALPLLFGLTLLQPRPSVGGLSVTLLGIYWIGLALAHAVLLRGLPHGAGHRHRRARGHLPRRTPAPTSADGCLGAGPWRRRSRPTRPSRGWPAGCSSPWSRCGSPALPGLGCQGDALLLGLAVAVLGPIGDLFESLVKRDAGTKDTGGVFGAHGGALDRLDAVIFTIVAGYYVWLAVMQ